MLNYEKKALCEFNELWYTVHSSHVFFLRTKNEKLVHHWHELSCNEIHHWNINMHVAWTSEWKSCRSSPIALDNIFHGDVIKWKHFLRSWPFVREIHRLPVNSPHKGQWREDLMFSFICAWINGWVNNPKAGDLRRHHAHYDVTVMSLGKQLCCHCVID